MAQRFLAKGDEVIYGAEVSALKEHASSGVIHTRQGQEYEAATLIGGSGLMAYRLVSMQGIDPCFIICLFRGVVFPPRPRT